MKVFTDEEAFDIAEGLWAANKVFEMQDIAILLAKGWVASEGNGPADAAYREAGRTMLKILDPEE